MDFKSFSQNFADKIDCKYNDYDDSHSIFVIPIKYDRFQTVIARVVKLEKYNYDVVQITSKVCETTESIDYPSILEASSDFALANFIVEGGFLKVDASILLNEANVELLGDSIVELANLADEWEFKITGKDIY